jgi:maltose O-acetyltransferase
MEDSFWKNVQIGVIPLLLFSGYTYLEARNENSEIKIGNNVAINNAFLLFVSNVTIKDNVLIGGNCTIIT